MPVALVTGGSRGIGRAIVEEFCTAGYAVAFTYAQRHEEAESLAERLRAGGAAVCAYRADVRELPAAHQVVHSTQQTLGPIDLLVNNAGIRRDKALVTMDPSLWHEVIDTNLTGTFNYSRAVINDMISRGGVILNISSVSGITGLAGQTNYSASKAAVIGFTKALSREVARFGIRVNAIAPGYVETEMTDSIPEAARKQMYARVPAGRAANAREVATLALYLAREDAAYVTGQVFTIDGGMS